MTFTVDAEHLGTSEASWLAFSPLTTAPLLSWPAPGRVVVVAPHPDDEVLAVGGTMRALAEIGHEVEIVAVTDGEASHPRRAPAEIAHRRVKERAAALACLGVTAEVVSLHCADGGVARVERLADAIAERLDSATCCFAPWDRDGHPDHDAAGIAARHACARTGVRLFQYPVWAWHWGRPRWERSLPWNRARRVLLTPEIRQSKGLAIGAYRSQIEPLGDDEPILPRSVLERFQRTFETFFT